MDFSSFLALLTQELAIDAPVSSETVLKETEWWDSMSILDVIALVDREFGLPFDFEEFKQVVTVNDLFLRITRKMGQ